VTINTEGIPDGCGCIVAAHLRACGEQYLGADPAVLAVLFFFTDCGTVVTPEGVVREAGEGGYHDHICREREGVRITFTGGGRVSKKITVMVGVILSTSLIWAHVIK
jgi:hypothetical protein